MSGMRFTHAHSLRWKIFEPRWAQKGSVLVSSEAGGAGVSRADALSEGSAGTDSVSAGAAPSPPGSWPVAPDRDR